MKALTAGIVVLSLFAFAGAAMACPASYVKGKAVDAENSTFRDKCHSIADKYLTARGVNPTSFEGEVMKPYIIGTTWVDHTIGLSNPQSSWGHRIDQKSVDECVQDNFGCTHHNQHFGDAQQIAGQSNPTAAKSFGG